MNDKKFSVLAAIALTACMILGLSGWTVESARAVDLDQECSLTVSPGEAEDLQNADVVLDLYQVARAVPVSGYDTYAYEAVAPYGELADALADSQSLTNEKYQELSQQAAEITLTQGNTVAKKIDGASAGEKIEGLEAGLYLVIARGSEVADYVTKAVDETGSEKLATIAWSDEYVYTYLPELISLPGKEAVDGTISTANPGDWLYDASATLKPSQSLRFGSLEIVKTLTSYETSGPADFVFQVEAYKDETKAEVVYSNVVRLSFTGAGSQSTVLADVIPVGAYVEVTEVYSGASYSLVSEATATAVIQAAETAKVSFTNEYNSSGNQGGAVTNRFDYNSESGWGWTQE